MNEKTFNNPSQADNKFSEQTFKCEQCDFKAARKFDLENHKEEKHNWCSSCFSTFNSKKEKKKNILTRLI